MGTNTLDLNPRASLTLEDVQQLQSRRVRKTIVHVLATSARGSGGFIQGKLVCDCYCDRFLYIPARLSEFMHFQCSNCKIVYLLEYEYWRPFTIVE